jgi:acyl CoA:acetate/3-ketoacid CoA transferase alpha subunit
MIFADTFPHHLVRHLVGSGRTGTMGINMDMAKDPKGWLTMIAVVSPRFSASLAGEPRSFNKKVRSI